MTGRIRTLLCLAVTVLLLSPTSGRAEEEFVVETGVVYGKGGERDLELDLARPKSGEGPFPAIVYVHGGGWRQGSRAMYGGKIREAAKRGYVAVTITYRLTDPDENGVAKTPFPAQIEDAKCAVRWLRANAKKYNVKPDRIGAEGGSAGGHLSLLLGVTDTSQALEGAGGNPDVSSRVQAVVNYFGPTDMVHMNETSNGATSLVVTLLGGTADKAAKQYQLASPVSHASKDDPPILTIHGTDDKLVPPDQATRFDEAMKKVGANHTLLMIEGAGHGFKGEAFQQANKASFDFFDKHLKK